MKKGFLSLLLLGIVAVLLLLGLTIFGPWELPGFGQLSQRQIDQAISAAEVPTIPPGDSDQDGFTDEVERWIKTDASDNCADDANDSAWPPDINNDKQVTQADAEAFRPYILKRVNNSNRRFDLNADKKINIGDVILLGQYINKGCPFQFLTADAKSDQVNFLWKPGVDVDTPTKEEFIIFGYNITKYPSQDCNTAYFDVAELAFTESFNLQTSYIWNKNIGGDKFVPGDQYCTALIRWGPDRVVSSVVKFTIPAPSSSSPPASTPIGNTITSY